MTTNEHPMAKAPDNASRRCFYGGVPAVARQGRNGYVNVDLLRDPGYGSMCITGTAPGNVVWIDPSF